MTDGLTIGYHTVDRPECRGSLLGQVPEPATEPLASQVTQPAAATTPGEGKGSKSVTNTVNVHQARNDPGV